MEERISLGPVGDLIGYHLRRASGVVGADFARVMAGTGMRQVLVGVLSIIAANPGINQGAIGRSLGIQRANMVSLMNELIDRDLVVRNVSPSDRRAFVFTLTDAGNVALGEAMARIRAHEKRVFGGLSAADIATMLDFLSRIQGAA